MRVRPHLIAGEWIVSRPISSDCGRRLGVVVLQVLEPALSGASRDGPRRRLARIVVATTDVLARAHSLLLFVRRGRLPLGLEEGAAFAARFEHLGAHETLTEFLEGFVSDLLES